MQPDALLAPTQTYILLSITIATLSWLSTLRDVGLVPEAMQWPTGLLFLYQLTHVIVAAMLPAEVNFFAHALALTGYMLISSWTLSTNLLETQSRPPR